MTPKHVPRYLSTKLKAIRKYKGWTLSEMAEAVGRKEESRRSRVHEWEKGTRQPDLLVLLAYARLVGISTDILIDDELKLELDTDEIVDNKD
jgi:transcriptional regulator with XRE-family HTH domain